MEEVKQFDCSGSCITDKGGFSDIGKRFTVVPGNKTNGYKTHVYANLLNCTCEELSEDISKAKLQIKQQMEEETISLNIDMEKEKQFDCSGFDMMEDSYFGVQGAQFTLDTGRKPYVYHNWANCVCSHMKEQIESEKLKIKPQEVIKSETTINKPIDTLFVQAQSEILKLLQIIHAYEIVIAKITKYVLPDDLDSLINESTLEVKNAINKIKEENGK